MEMKPLEVSDNNSFPTNYQTKVLLMTSLDYDGKFYSVIIEVYFANYS